MHGRACQQYTSRCYITHLSVEFVLMKIRKDKISHFYGSFRNEIMTMKGLIRHQQLNRRRKIYYGSPLLDGDKNLSL